MCAQAGAAIRAVAVVVPVHNEQDRLERCLRGIARAVSGLPDAVSTQVVIALDGCTDRSAAIASHWPFTTLELPRGGVGQARAVAAAAASAAFAHLACGDVWIANTDADSAVPEHWLRGQLALADGGWDVVLGTVQPDLLDLPPELHRSAAAQAATEGEPVYGANLGVRASAYHRAGGFPPVRQHEDTRLVAALRSSGARITSSYDLAVLTSGRPRGRAPGGYAAYLRGQAAMARREGADTSVARPSPTAA